MHPVWPSSQFQAWQALSMISSVVRKTQCDTRLSRKYNHSPLDRVELGRVGRQKHQAEVFGYGEIAALCPLCPSARCRAPPGATACDSSARQLSAEFPVKCDDVIVGCSATRT